MFCFSNKNLGGSIYENSYYMGLAGVLGSYLGAHLTSRYGNRTLVISNGLCLITGIIICLVETQCIIPPNFFLNKFEGSHSSKI